MQLTMTSAQKRRWAEGLYSFDPEMATRMIARAELEDTGTLEMYERAHAVWQSLEPNPCDWLPEDKRHELATRKQEAYDKMKAEMEAIWGPIRKAEMEAIWGPIRKSATPPDDPAKLS